GGDGFALVAFVGGAVGLAHSHQAEAERGNGEVLGAEGAGWQHRTSPKWRTMGRIKQTPPGPRRNRAALPAFPSARLHSHTGVPAAAQLSVSPARTADGHVLH